MAIAPRTVRDLATGTVAEADLAALSLEAEANPAAFAAAVSDLGFDRQCQLLDTLFGRYFPASYLLIGALLAAIDSIGDEGTRQYLVRKAQVTAVARADQVQGLSDQLRQQQQRLSGQLKELAAQVSQIAAQEANVERLRADWAKIRDKWEEQGAIRAEVADLEANIARCRSELAAVSPEAVAARRESLGQLQAESDSQREKAGQLGEALARAQAERDAAMATVSEQQRTLDQVSGETEGLRRQKADLERQVSVLRDEGRVVVERMVRLRVDNEQLQREQEGMMATYKAEKENHSKLNEILERLRAAYAKALGNVPSSLSGDLRERIEQAKVLLDEEHPRGLKRSVLDAIGELGRLSGDAVPKMMRPPDARRASSSQQ